MRKTSHSMFLAAAAIYAVFAIYLYQPYFKNFNALQYLLVANLCLGSVGCFVLSRRWVSSFAGSFFAGAMYGFSPFALWLTGYHPAAGLLAASVPWLFCPAAFGPGGRWRWLRWLLAALPFLAIVLFFQQATVHRLFAVPRQLSLQSDHVLGLVAPLVAVKRNLTPVGFYHVPMVPLLMGLFMLLAARRFAILIIFGLGVVLAFSNPFPYEPFSQVSPVIWLAIPALCCAVMIGAGIQGFASAGPADRKWLFTVAVIMLALSSMSLLLATKCQNIFAGLGLEYAKLLMKTAWLYVLGATAAGIIFFMARAKLRLTWLRLSILCSAIGVDIFIGARFIVDEMF